MRVTVIPVTPFRQNCSLLRCERTGEAAIVDPGGDLDLIEAAIASERADVRQVLLTHGHLDHAGAAAQLARRIAVPIVGPHRDDAFLLDALAEYGARYGFSDTTAVEPNRWLDDGDTVDVGECRLDVIHCPGHTPGHVVFYDAASNVALVGDVIFNGSVGRTDLPRGSYPALVDSIRRKLWPLGEFVTFYPGHGPTSTFGWERKCNPFVADLAFDDDD
jgi:glyoxylase-like metal-dependent hydrolase (beta-lactamase superfamily II)